MQSDWTAQEIKWMFDTTSALAFKFRAFDIYDHEDYVQAAMMKAIQKRDGRLPSVRWLYLTIRSVVLDLARSTTRRCKQSSMLDIDDRLCQKVGFLTAAVEERVNSRIDRNAAVVLVFEALSKEHCEVLALRSAGWSYREIAEKTGSAIGTVRSRIHYARAKARRIAGHDVVSAALS